jgi:uncharacterized protein with beta-barrel porin domain
MQNRSSPPRATPFTLAFVLALGLSLGLEVAAPRSAEAACTPDPPTADTTEVTCSGTDSTGFDGSAVDGLTVNVVSGAELDDSDPTLDAALLVGEDNRITFESNTILRVVDDGGAGVRGGDDNTVTLNGLVRVIADDARAVSIGSRTPPDPLEGDPPNRNPPGQITLQSASSRIDVLGNRSIGLEAGDDLGVRVAGRIVAEGDDSVAISLGDRTRLDFQSLVDLSGALEVSGDRAIGIRVGDGWFANDVTATGSDQGVPTGAAVSLQRGSSIEVTGANAVGLWLGDDANPTGEHDSFANLDGSISVQGLDAVGVSLGGNGLFTDTNESGAIEEELLTSGFPPTATGFSLSQLGTITGGPDAGSLVVVRNAGAGENRIILFPGAALRADTTQAGTPGRGIALLGSDGRELVVNFGEIEGEVRLGAGDDRFAQASGGSFTGVLDGGAGDDTLLLAASGLAPTTSGTESFDLSMLVDFETVRVGGGDGWSLEQGAGFTGLVQVAAGGRLVATAPTSLGGDLEIDPTGAVEVVLDGVTTPLTVAGQARLDGSLRITPAADLEPGPTPLRVLQAGSRLGEFAEIEFAEASGIRRFTPEYDATGLSVLFELLPLDTLARGENNLAVVRHLIAVGESGSGSDDVQALFDALPDLSVGEANRAFDALSPEAYDAQTTIVVEAGRRVARLLLDRPRECTPGQRDPWTASQALLPCHPRSWSPWVAGLGSFRSRDSFNGHPGYDANLGGLAFGIDVRPIESLDLTFAIASQRGALSVRGASNSTLTLTDLMAHAAWTRGPLRLQTVVGWGHGFHDDRRRIRFTNVDGSETDLRGTTDHDSDRLTWAAEIGIELQAGAITVEPLVGIDWAWVWQRGFTESEAGGLGLRVDDRRDSIGSIDAGLRLSTVYHHTRYLGRQLLWMDGVWRPRLDLRWRQMLAGNERRIDARLSGAPDGVGDFAIEGKEDSRGLELAASVSFIPKTADRLQFDLRYETFIAAHTIEQGLNARILVAF